MTKSHRVFNLTRVAGRSRVSGRARRILNITSGFQLKPAQAERAIENCAAMWVEKGVSIRSVTLAEAVAMRNQQAQMREPLPYAELPGLVYSPGIASIAGNRRERELAVSANLFATGAVQA
jgi:hypothetical protein